MAQRRVHRIYTEEDQAKIAAALLLNDGNIKGTARDLGLPFSTIATWKKKWDLYGYPEKMEEVLPAQREDFIEAATEVRWMMLERLREKVRRNEVSSRELITGVDRLTDKINILSGLATSRSEHKHIEIQLPDPDALAKALASYVQRTVEEANRRDGIIDVEFTSKPLALVEGNNN